MKRRWRFFVAIGAVLSIVLIASLVIGRELAIRQAPDPRLVGCWISQPVATEWGTTRLRWTLHRAVAEVHADFMGAGNISASGTYSVHAGVLTVDLEGSPTAYNYQVHGETLVLEDQTDGRREFVREWWASWLVW